MLSDGTQRFALASVPERENEDIKHFEWKSNQLPVALTVVPEYNEDLESLFQFDHGSKVAGKR